MSAVKLQSATVLHYRLHWTRMSVNCSYCKKLDPIPSERCILSASQQGETQETMQAIDRRVIILDLWSQ